MREYYLPSDIRSADTIAVEKFSVPSVVLMENAAKNAAAEAVKLAGGIKKRFLALAGRGNNGGDAFAAVRHLLLAGCEEAVIVKTVSDESYSCDAKVNLDILRRMTGNFPENLKIYDSANLNDDDIFSLCNNADCIIDGLLGTGASGAPRGEIGRIIGLLKPFGNVLSLDIPSGVDASTGVVYEPSVKAAVTATFLAPKFGAAFAPARDYCGEVKVHDIGVPKSLLLPERPALTEFERSDLHDMIPPLSRDIHKTNRGNLLIIAGSETYRGAPLLTALGALRAGAGIVYLAVPDVIAPYISAELPEVIVIPL
ncbi:MAG: NAD(P)H-hydrate epimerase, partial [Synergistes sp.]|nr:NAD(P)H-hydrate epimerase [Synergistes sp.]